MIKMSCTAHDAGHSATVAAGDGFAQGIFSLWSPRTTLPTGCGTADLVPPQRNKSRTNGRVLTHAACIFAKEKGLRSSNLKPSLSAFY